MQLPEGMNGNSRSGTRSLSDWQSRGVRRVGGGDLPQGNMRGAIVLPLRKSGPAFLVYRNYRTFLSWNESTFFAISLGALADRVSEQGSSRVCGR